MMTKAKTPRATALFVVRESDEHDTILFDAMRYQTYATHLDNPHVAAVVNAGMEPMSHDTSFATHLLEPGCLPREVTVLTETLTEGSTRAVLFQLGDTWHLWSMASAAKRNDDGTNGFTSILVKVIERIRPHTVIVANISRLIRSQEQGALLTHCMAKNVDLIKSGPVELHLTGPNSAVGMMMLSMFSTIASMEREWIVTRLLAGKIAKWRRGEWLLGESTVPFGYTYNPETKKLEVDMNAAPQVQRMMEILSQDVAPATAVDMLTRAGVRMLRRKDKTGAKASTALVRNARLVIDTLLSWVPIWAQGEYLLRHANPLAAPMTIAGLDPVQNDADDPGEFQMLCKVPLPPKGWAPKNTVDELVAAAMRRSTERVSDYDTRPRPLCSSTLIGSANPDVLEAVLSPMAMLGNDKGSRTRRSIRRGKRTIALLSGTSWESDGVAYEIQVQKSGAYVLKRAPARTATTEVAP